MSDKIEGVNPARIAWCCSEFGVTPEQLAGDVGIATSTIAKAMSGGTSLSFSQLEKIAGYFGRGVLFFLEQEAVNEDRVHSPQFRTLANEKPGLSREVSSLIERAEKQREVYLGLREELGEDGWPRFEPPVVTNVSPRQVARVARKWLGLTDQRTFDEYRDAVESRGVLVFRSNGYAGPWQIPKQSPILGFNLYDSTCPLIVVRKLDVEVRQTFTLMHELGHVLLHRTSSIDDEADLVGNDGAERQANQFAGFLLVPDSVLSSIQDSERPHDVAEYDTWLQDERRGSRAYRHREPMHVFGRTFVRTVFDALNAKHITLSRASGYLDELKVNDLRRLEAHCAGL